MAYWQMAAGERTIDISPIFFTFEVALVGPGNPGEYPANRHIYDDPSHWAYRDYLPLFAREMLQGDFIILKKPAGRQWEILAVGQVESDYLYDPSFRNVEWWDMQHCRKVDWRRPKERVLLMGLRRGTLQRLENEDVIRAALEIWESNL